MSSIYLFGLMSRNNQWLSVRQSTIAANIANVNTPGYKAQDTRPFEAVLDSTGLSLNATSPMHMTNAGQASEVVNTDESDASEIVHSGNSVNLETEMMKASEANRSYALNTSVLKTFQNMILSCAK
jgi:flagellar basal-body rod protein FlgB